MEYTLYINEMDYLILSVTVIEMQDINYNPSDTKPYIICMPYKTDELLVQLVGSTVPVLIMSTGPPAQDQ